MRIYELASDKIVALAETRFAEADVKERSCLISPAHLQIAGVLGRPQFVDRRVALTLGPGGDAPQAVNLVVLDRADRGDVLEGDNGAGLIRSSV